MDNFHFLLHSFLNYWHPITVLLTFRNYWIRHSFQMYTRFESQFTNSDVYETKSLCYSLYFELPSWCSLGEFNLSISWCHFILGSYSVSLNVYTFICPWDLHCPCPHHPPPKLSASLLLELGGREGKDRALSLPGIWTNWDPVGWSTNKSLPQKRK